MSLEKNKQEVILKSGNRCCICTTVGIQAHHIKPKSQEGSDDLDNLAPLCPNCHSKTHSRGGFTLQIKEETLKQFRDSWYNSYNEKKSFFKIDGYNIKLVQKLKNFKFLCDSKMVFSSKSWEKMFGEYIPKNLDITLRSDDYITYLGYGIQDLDDIKESLKKIKVCYNIKKLDKEIRKEFKELCDFFNVVL